MPTLGGSSRLDDRSYRGPSSWRVFGAAVLRDQRTVGAIAPSSARLASRLAELVPDDGEPIVVELGPGTGSVTSAISSRLAGRGHHLALETKPELVAFLHNRYPQVLTKHADAGEIASALAAHELGPAHAVISSLPWSLFTPDTQLRLLRRISASLRPDGVFTTFAYLHGLALPGAQWFRRALTERFGEVRCTRPVWANLPPAITYVCRAPRPVETSPRDACRC